MKNTHEFTIIVNSNDDKKAAELALLSCFAKRGPDDHEFNLQGITAKDDAPDPYAELKRWLKEDGVIQYLSGNKWENITEPFFSEPVEYYRRKPRLVTVPLGPEDVPPGSVVRGHDFSDGCWSVVHSIGEDCIFINDDEAVSFESMKYDNWLINRSLSRGAWDATAWERCEKEMEVAK